MLEPVNFNFNGAAVRIITRAGEPWFVAADVCAALGIGNASLAVNGNPTRGDGGIDADDKGVATVNTPGGTQTLTIVNEPGLYTLIFKSRKPEAKRFRKWVTAEVLPAIRRTGSYSVAAVPRTLSEALRPAADEAEAIAAFENPAVAARAWAARFEAEKALCVSAEPQAPSAL